VTTTPIFRSQDVSRSPGVYVFRNQAGEVIYVGKAKNLRNRMRSYFMPSTARRNDPKLRALIHSIASYQTFELSSESEALLLEAQFIKQYNPRYNIEMRDDKRYLHIRVDLAETFPRFSFARLRRDDGCLYFGPFPQAVALRETVRILEKRFGLRSCNCPEPNEETRRHCLEHVLRDCCSPCVGNITRQEYLARLEQALAVLRGEEGAARIAAELQGRMKDCAARLDFEEAARLREQADAATTAQAEAEGALDSVASGQAARLRAARQRAAELARQEAELMREAPPAPEETDDNP